MNPYLSVSIAMCVIVLLALVGTAYMAVFFNRRAKSDLEAALQPLGEVIGGEANVEEAIVSGRYATPGGGQGCAVGRWDGAGVSHIGDRWGGWRQMDVDGEPVKGAWWTRHA